MRARSIGLVLIAAGVGGLLLQQLAEAAPRRAGGSRDVAVSVFGGYNCPYDNIEEQAGKACTTKQPDYCNGAQAGPDCKNACGYDCTPISLYTRSKNGKMEGDMYVDVERRLGICPQQKISPCVYCEECEICYCDDANAQYKYFACVPNQKEFVPCADNLHARLRRR